MMAATAETTQGSPIVPTSEGDKIISEWVAPVSPSPPPPFALPSLTPLSPAFQIKSLALEHLHNAQTNVEQSDDAHPHTVYDPLSPLSLAELTDHHVVETVRLISESFLVREAWEQGMELSVHGWVYHVATAKLRDLGVGVCGGALPVPVFAAGAEETRR